jgi:hypothetical protein
MKRGKRQKEVVEEESPRPKLGNKFVLHIPKKETKLPLTTMLIAMYVGNDAVV